MSMNRKNISCGSVKVGSRGQVVIPLELRKKLGIKEGEVLLAVCDGTNIKLVRPDILAKLVED
jgi:AbrB family looped-hinge helix DNA binding protein